MKTKSLYLAALAGVLCTALASKSWAAITLGGQDEMELSGIAQTRVTFSTQDREGFTSPQVDSGSLLQHRNLAYVEWRHTLTNRVSYRLKVRGLYEGVYDYGPEEYRDAKDLAEDADIYTDADLWEGYVDVAPGPAFLRVGKQIISWGETDLFPMLDRINPLDNTWGGIFENLDDRRLPIWATRGIYTFGNIGFLQSVALEGFFNPGFIEQEVSPLSPPGTPYAFPLPPAPLPLRIIEPEDGMKGSRWGVRLQGVIGDNYNFSLAHYQTFLDTPATRLVIDPGGPVQELIYSDVLITGGSLSFFEQFTETIWRFELAYHWDEPVFIPEVNLSGTGEIPEKDIFRFAVAVDKNVWIRFLNKRSMYNFTLQYFGEYILDYDDAIRLAAFKFPSGEFAELDEYEQKITFFTYTNYLSGKLNPQVALAWDPRGAVMVLPQVTYIFEPLRFTLQYALVAGENDVSLGFLRDRDQISLTLSVLF
jgi:hypothetical protein